MEIRTVIVLALGLVFAAFIHGGVYQLVPSGENMVHRVNKLTGDVTFCVGYQCASAKEITRPTDIAK